MGHRASHVLAHAAAAGLLLLGGHGTTAVEAADQWAITARTPAGGRTTPPKACIGPSVIDIGDFEMWIHRQLSAEVVGYGFAISEGGVPVGAGQGGFAQIPVLDNNVLFTHQTDIQVASVSKTITAVALLQQMEALGITPDDAISPYLPAHWEQGDGFGDGSITFDDLLTHRTGVDQVLAAMINGAEEPLPNSNTWEGLEALVARGIPASAAATSCPTPNDDGTFTLGGAEDPADGHYGVFCYKNANYALARVLIWRLALLTGDLGPVFDEQDKEAMPLASASGYQLVVQNRVLMPAGVMGFCKASGPPATRSLMYDITGNVPFVMLTAGADAYKDDESALLQCGPYNWSLSAMDLVKIMGDLSCGDLLSAESKALMNERKMGWNQSSNTGSNVGRYWHGGRWTQTRSSAAQALWPLHPDHPENNPAASAADCVMVGTDLVCPASGPSDNRIHSCVVEFPFGIDAALIVNSDLRSDPEMTACDVLMNAFDEVS